MGAVQTATNLGSQPPNFETVWAILQEVAERQKETAQQMKETDRKIGKLGDRFGEWVEYMVMPNLVEKFRELDFVFTRAYPHATIKDKEHNIFAEIDITLENGDKVMIVECKSKPTTEDITGHVKRMEKVRAHADLHKDNRKYLGAIAGMVINDNEKAFAMSKGFYVIEPSRGEPSPGGSVEDTGETFIVTEPSGQGPASGYSPREW